MIHICATPELRVNMPCQGGSAASEWQQRSSSSVTHPPRSKRLRRNTSPGIAAPFSAPPPVVAAAAAAAFIVPRSSRSDPPAPMLSLPWRQHKHHDKEPFRVLKVVPLPCYIQSHLTHLKATFTRVHHHESDEENKHLREVIYDDSGAEHGSFPSLFKWHNSLVKDLANQISSFMPPTDEAKRLS